jgi:hypothetical protein
MSANNYLCIQRGQASGDAPREAPSPAEMEQMYARFNAWREKFQANIVDLGGRLGAGKTASAEGVSDGPFVEAKEVIGGFMILTADSLDEAVDIASQCPGVTAPGSRVEVREINVP